MKKIGKPDQSGDSSSFSCLPDEILLQILSRLIDLKTLCCCKLVSIRFNHIVQQVNAISFTITSVDHPSFDSNSSGAPSEGDPYVFIFEYESFVSAVKSLRTFSGLKSVCIEIPSFHKASDNHFSFKWKFEFDNRTDSFLFLSPNSVCDTKENVQDEEEQEEEENVELSELKRLIAAGCVVDALIIRFTMLHYMNCFPLLENVTITDTSKRGKVSLCGGKIVDLRKCLRSDLEQYSCNKLHRCYVPLLKLPVSGYMMKGVTLALFEMNDLVDDDSFTNINLNDFEDKEEAAYNEAMMEIFKKNRQRIFG